MAVLSIALSAFMAILHVYIMVLEMILWATPRGHKTFKMTPEYAEQTRVLAANQGLYNGFLAAGLFWSLIHPDSEFATQLRLFFLGCIVVAGVYGGMTATRRIFYVQMTPAIVSLAIVALGW